MLLECGFENEDVVFVVLKFDIGVIVIVFVFDGVVFFWSWEMIFKEYFVYFNVFESCYLIGGLYGFFLILDLCLWIYKEECDWWLLILVVLMFCECIDLLFN